MTTVNVPNNITAGTAISAPPVHENFQYLEGILNDDMIHADGSKPFEAIPTVPALDPSSDNQLTRKKYVDNGPRVLARRQHTSSTAFAVGGAGPTDSGISTIDFVMPSLRGGTNPQLLELSLFVPKFTLAQDAQGWPPEGSAMGVSLRPTADTTKNLVFGQAITTASNGFTSHPSLYAKRTWTASDAAFLAAPGATVGLKVYIEMGNIAGQFQLLGSADFPCEFVVRVI